MKSRTWIRAVVVATALAATTFVADATVAPRPAQATYADCTFVLVTYGYYPTTGRKQGCSEGASGQAGAWLFCHNILVANGVGTGVATHACEEAGHD